MHRSPTASLSPREFLALRALRLGVRSIPEHERKLLISMGLTIDEPGGLKLSPAGLARLEREDRDGPGFSQR
jgi:hypothetical protein